MSNDNLPDWEEVLSSAAHLQRILPDSVLVGGTAASVYATHRMSTDADHVLTDLKQRFDDIQLCFIHVRPLIDFYEFLLKQLVNVQLYAQASHLY